MPLVHDPNALGPDLFLLLKCHPLFPCKSSLHLLLSGLDILVFPLPAQVEHLDGVD